MKHVFAVQQASTLCGENETEIFTSLPDAEAHYKDLLNQVNLEDEDIDILEHTASEIYFEDSCAGTYNRIAIETIKIQ